MIGSAGRIFNFDHRKVWIDEQLVQQARYFGIDLLCQAILSNHIHLVLRSRPDVVAEWDDNEVARRWLMLCPLRRDEQRQPEEPTEFEINSVRNDKQKLATIRSRLSDISWWMRLLSQNIAQRANREDQELGKFWQARDRAVRLLDETALLACAAYVDLNPIRAAIAETIEGSDFTSAQKRCRDLQARVTQTGATSDPPRSVGAHWRSGEKQAEPTHATAAVGSSAGTTVNDQEIPTSRCSRHLAPVDLKERSGRTGPDRNKQGVRCSNKGFLPMSAADYLSLLDWTARQQRAGSGRGNTRGSTPKHVAPLFERLGINVDTWCRLVQDFGRLFSVVAGQPQRIDEHRSKKNSRRYHARRETRDLPAGAFAEPSRGGVLC